MSPVVVLNVVVSWTRVSEYDLRKLEYVGYQTFEHLNGHR